MALAPLLSRADVGPPAHLRITEREPGLFVTQWRVPKVLPPRAVPLPDLPESCERLGDYSVEDQAQAWLFTQDWRCDSGLAGELVGMRYPFADLALTTVVRVDLLSGDRFAHLLSPGEGPWRLPEGTAAPDVLQAAARAVASGVSHALGSWVHLPFVLAVGLLGDLRRSIRVVSIFALGQLVGAVAALQVPGLGIAPAEIGLSVAAALVAREALRPVEKRRRILALAAVGGAVHGLAIGSMVGDESAGIVVQLLTVLGMDAVHLVCVAAVAALWTLAPPIRKGLVYAAGTGGFALALSLAIAGGVAENATTELSLPSSGQAIAGSAASSGGSRRVAPAAPDAPIQSFLSVEPFEVRHEAMLRLAGLAETLGLAGDATLEVTDQPGLAERLAALVLDGVDVRIDGASFPGIVRRADFMTVDATGALPRATPVPESVSDAVIGVVVAYPTPGMPQAVSLTWDPFPSATPSIPATVIDPEVVRTQMLTAGTPWVEWDNTLAEDPLPTVAAVTVEPVLLPVPLASLPLLALVAVVLIVGVRRRVVEVSIATARVILVGAIVLGPLWQTTMALPASAGNVPSERQARRILAGLLPNIYRALEFRDEAVIYDRLAVSVTGETLTEVYLEQRRALELEERGGAQARVEAVEVLDAREIEPGEVGFGVRSTWTVGGMVTHFARPGRWAAW